MSTIPTSWSEISAIGANNTSLLDGQIDPNSATDDHIRELYARLKQIYSTMTAGNSYIHPNHSGDVTSIGDGVQTVAPNAITNAKLADAPANTIKGNNTGATADPLDLTAAQVTAMLNLFDSSLKGLVPPSGGGTTNFLRADGTFAAPSGSSGVNWFGTITGTVAASASGITDIASTAYVQNAITSGGTIYPAGYRRDTPTARINPSSITGQPPISF